MPANLRSIVLCLILAVVCISSSTLTGQLVRPAQVAVVAATGNAESQALAAYYCEKRGVEKSRVLSLEFPAGDELDRDVWETQLRPQIQNWLVENDPAGEITSFVTTFGVPLAISQWNDDSETELWTKFYDAALSSRFDSLNKTLRKLAALAEVEFVPADTALSAQDLGKQFDQVASSCQQAVAGFPADKQAASNQLLQESVRAIAGLSPFVNGMKAEMAAGNGERLQLVSQLERAIGIQLGFREGLAALDRMPTSFDREIAIMETLERSAGLLGVIEWIRNQASVIERNESLASFDSELCLVTMQGYRRVGAYPIADAVLLNSTGSNRMFEVTRIDGPTAAVAQTLLDRAVAAGNAGVPAVRNVYVDKRGLPANANPKDLKIEQWLDLMATNFGGILDFKVTQDDGPDLFGEGACPDTSIYLGWYGLGKFRDAFTFAPGATAYHLVPGDALGIHDPADTGWCKGFLENGATYVVGSVSDPFVIDLGIDDLAAEGTGSLPVRPRRSNCSDGSVIFGDFLYAK